MKTIASVKTLPVIETFGPTIQGEGTLAGLPTMFVRFGGCDYRCSWCDSMYAVEPAQVRANAEKLTAVDIVNRLARDVDGSDVVRWITLSGGNPALLDLEELVRRLHDFGFKVAVETQGSRWREWLGRVDCLTVSPKPPSSGMATEAHAVEFGAFMVAATQATQEEWVLRNRDVRALKIVVFDDDDLAWARDVIEANHDWPAYLSAGTNPVGMWGSEVVKAVNERQARDEIGDRYRWLCERVSGDRAFRDVRVLPQLHVIAWGHSRGV